MITLMVEIVLVVIQSFMALMFAFAGGFFYANNKRQRKDPIILSLLAIVNLVALIMIILNF